MKLRTRNAIITVLMILSLALCLGFAVILGYRIFSGDFSWTAENHYTLLQNFFLTKYNFIAIIASIFVTLIYAFIVFLYIDVDFEKTQSSEIIYFGMFLVGCLAEHARLVPSVFGLWESSSIVLTFACRALIFGRTLAVLGLLFAVIYSEYENRQYIEQNIVILVAVSLLVGKFFPVNSAFILPTGHLQLGFSHLFKIFQIVIFVLAAVSLCVKTYLAHVSRFLPLGFLLLGAGYLILTESYNILFGVIGSALIFTGTFMYLRAIHRLYLWN